MSNPSLPPIRSRQELRQAMGLVKERLAVQEKSLAQRAEKLPAEALKTAFSRFLPGAVSGFLARQGWQLLRYLPTIYTFFSLFRKNKAK